MQRSSRNRLERLEALTTEAEQRSGMPPIYEVRRSDLEALRHAHPAPSDWKMGDPPYCVIVVRSDDESI